MRSKANTLALFSLMERKVKPILTKHWTHSNCFQVIKSLVLKEKTLWKESILLEQSLIGTSSSLEMCIRWNKVQFTSEFFGSLWALGQRSWYEEHDNHWVSSRFVSDPLTWLRNGNVAVDVARIFAKSVEELRPTDINNDTLELKMRKQTENVMALVASLNCTLFLK